MAMGMVMMVMGMTAIIVAQGDRTTAFQRTENGSSFSVTEGGIARLLSQLAQADNATLLVRDYDTLNPKTGSTYLGPDGVLNSGDEEDAAVDEWTNCIATASSCTSSGSPDMTTSGTIGTHGQFSLKAYRFDSTEQKGTLLVEGQQGDSTSYVLVTVSIDISSDINAPGLWISWNPNSDAGSDVQLQTNIQDSTSTSDSDASKVDKLKAQQMPIASTGASVSYDSTPDAAFPALPTEGENPPPTGVAGAYSISAIKNLSTLPESGQTAVDGVLTYHVGANGDKSISLSGGSNLTVGTGSETVILYLDGGIDLSGGSTITITPGTKLIIYAHGKVTLSGGSGTNAIGNSGALEDAQLYIYGANDMNFSGGSGMKMFVFAPDSAVNFSSSSNIRGVIWAKSWKGSGTATIMEEPLDLSKTMVQSSSGTARIIGVKSWQKAQL